jgi:hypothetical protein
MNKNPTLVYSHIPQNQTLVHTHAIPKSYLSLRIHTCISQQLHFLLLLRITEILTWATATALFRYSNQEKWYGRRMLRARLTGNFHVGFWWENLKKIENFEEMGVDGRTIFKEIFKKCNGGRGGCKLNWSAQDKDKCWRAFVNAVMFHIRALGYVYSYVAGLNKRKHTDKICFYHILKFTHMFRHFLWRSSRCPTRILIKYNTGQLLCFTSILVTHAKQPAETWRWILIYDKRIFYQCAFVGLLHKR